MMILKKIAGLKASQHAILILAMAVVLGACSGGGDEPLELPENYEPEPEPVSVVEPEPAPAIDAATIDPCADQFVFQREINGAPDDTAVETSTAAGKSLTTLTYWYADSAMIVGFRYAEGEAWCNVWNESGVTWDR